MKNIVRALLTILVAGIFFTANAASVLAAGYLKFNQSSVSVTSGNTFQIQVVVNPGTDQIAGTDAYVTYNSSILEAQAVTAGTYFPSVSTNIAAGKVSIWGTTEPASPKSGEGTVATITFKALTNGSVTLQYYCDAAASNSSKIIKADINATNIISCSLNQTSAVTVSGASGGSSNPVPTSPPAAAAPTALPQTGGWEGTTPVAIGGILLLMVGALVRFIKI